MQCHTTSRLARIKAISVAGAAVVCLALVVLLLRLGGLPAHPLFEQTEISAPATAEEKPAARPDDDGTWDVDDAAERRATQSRRRMVNLQMRARDIVDRRVLEAMNKVPRHMFVPRAMRPYAYEDRPLSIGQQQTISQPYIVALMTQLAAPTNKARALDVGTGSGYQAAVLAEVVHQVYSIEIVKPLATEAERRLKSLGYGNVEVRYGDGYQGWKEHAPFDVIIVAAAPDHIPQPLVDQLAVGGRLVIPVGNKLWQDLLVVEKRSDGTVRKRKVAPVAFVPMTGQADRRPQAKPEK
jgi:protein-L-isoaspartate(D-aspartate) O-methyltransferase